MVTTLYLRVPELINLITEILYLLTKNFPFPSPPATTILYDIYW